MTMTIRQLLDEKGHDVLSIGPDNTVFDAVKMMADYNVGALVVLERDKLIGKVSERQTANSGPWLPPRESIYASWRSM